MKKRLLSCFLACTLLLFSASAALLPNFSEVNTYTGGSLPMSRPMHGTLKALRSPTSSATGLTLRAT